jgi:SAM-dependent methyltransferase
VGAGYTARALLQALAWNGKGRLVCVDSWHDTKGQEPEIAQELRARGVEIVVQAEEPFCQSCPADFADVLISDADHLRSDQWLGEHLRILRPGGWAFFHDTSNSEFPNLARILDGVKELPHWHFTASSRADERCERGWLMVHKPRCHIGVVACWDANMRELAAVTVPNHREYCQRWGLEYLGEEREPGDRHAAWLHFQLLREALPRFDWVVCLDLDLIFLNHTISLETYLDPDADFITTYDVNGLNCGVMLVRNTEWARSFLRRLWEAGPRFNGHPSSEQTALTYLLYKEPKKRWKVLPQKGLNSFLYGEYPWLDYPEGNYSSGDLILHMPARPNPRRIEVFQHYLREVIR